MGFLRHFQAHAQSTSRVCVCVRVCMCACTHARACMHVPACMHALQFRVPIFSLYPPPPTHSPAILQLDRPSTAPAGIGAGRSACWTASTPPGAQSCPNSQVIVPFAGPAPHQRALGRGAAPAGLRARDLDGGSQLPAAKCAERGGAGGHPGGCVEGWTWPDIDRVWGEVIGNGTVHGAGRCSRVRVRVKLCAAHLGLTSDVLFSRHDLSRQQLPLR